MVSEITTASSWEVCIPLTSSSVNVIASLSYLFAGVAVGSLYQDSASVRGLEQPPMMMCMTLAMGQLASNDGGM